MDIGEFNARRRTSEVSTLPRTGCNATNTIANGIAYGALAYAQGAATYTQVSICVIGAGVGLTDFKIGVWDDAGSLLASTANLHSGGALPGTGVQTFALAASLNVTLDQILYLGVAALGSSTAPTLRGCNMGSNGLGAAFGIGPSIGRSVGSWAGGTLPSLPAGTGQANLNWCELVP